MTGFELLPVVEAAAVALGTAAGTGIWADARAGLVALLGRGGHDEQETAGLLDETDTAVRAAPAAERDRVRAETVRDWQVRLRDLARRSPDIGEDLAGWVARVQRQAPPARQINQNVTASASGAVAQGALFGDVVNHAWPVDPSLGTDR